MTSSRWRRSGSGCARTRWASPGVGEPPPRDGLPRSPRGDGRQPRALALPGIPGHGAQRERPSAGQRARGPGCPSWGSPRCGHLTWRGPGRRRTSSVSTLVFARASTRGCGRPTAAAGKGGCSERWRPRSPSCSRHGCGPGPPGGFPVASRWPSSRNGSLPAVREIRKSADPPALVVCHGGSIRVVLCAAEPRGLDAFHSFEVPNAVVIAV